jgi:hypothetical protein
MIQMEPSLVRAGRDHRGHANHRLHRRGDGVFAEDAGKQFSALEEFLRWLRNIEEALHVAERILVLTRKPTTGKAESKVDLLRPRNFADQVFCTR